MIGPSVFHDERVRSEARRRNTGDSRATMSEMKTAVAMVAWPLLKIIPTAFIPRRISPARSWISNCRRAARLRHVASLGGCRRNPEALAEVTDIVEFVGGEDGEIRNGTTYISLVPRSERALTRSSGSRR